MSKLRTIGVVGLGTMGLGIAQVYAQAGITVIATDAHAPALHSAVTRLTAALERRVVAGKLPAIQRDNTLSNFRCVASLSALAPAELVIEAIAEHLDAKRRLFLELESIVADDAVLATNTSSLSVASIAAGMTYPDRMIGLHFFNPAPVMKLVELIAHERTNQASLDAARNLTEAAGKTVIACADTPGFIVNRCARPFYGEAMAMLEEGRSAGAIDAAMQAAGYPIGPFGLIDLIGADVHLAATQATNAAMHGHPRYHVFQALKAQVVKGELGRKSGRGFVFPDTSQAPPPDAEDIVLRIESTLANEAASLLADGRVTEANIDRAMKLGLNFPRGPFESARRHGMAEIRRTLTDLEPKAPPYLKGRYMVCPRLQAMT
jgi:3-hydroxybutyryl-CoA dehydrogenase